MRDVGTRMKDYADEVPCKLLFRKEGYFLYIDEADCKRAGCEGSGGLFRILKMEKGQIINESEVL